MTPWIHVLKKLIVSLMYISNDKGLSISLTVVLFQFLLFSECRDSYNCYNSPERVLKADGGSRAIDIQDFESKDIILGGLFTVYHSSAADGQFIL